MRDDDKNKDIVTPIKLDETREATGTIRWYVDGAKYEPTLATWKPLVNGEEGACNLNCVSACF
ncbi:hypothetical protein PT300_15155 [Enterobacteriaceae bacterium ESL0689]|nr:hypothetical protein [Enterobacteriaceae bacterium ESL0689]